MDPEVLQHVEDGLEPKVLDPALTVLVQGQPQVLGGPRADRFLIIQRSKWTQPETRDRNPELDLVQDWS